MENTNNEIIGKFPSLVGFATKSYNDGDKASILTQLHFYNMKDKSDEDIITAHGQIYSTLSQWIFPLILKKFSDQKLPNNFLLYAVYIEMYPDETKNKLVFNDGIKFRILGRTKPGLKFKDGDPVLINDITEIISIEKIDRDPNAATIMLVLNNGGWFGSFDFIYNRQNVREKCDRAIEFFDSAHDNYKKSNYNAYYQSLWDCSELLAESLLLLHNQIKLHTPHKKIREILKIFCGNHNLTFFEDHEKITRIRDHSRYGPPHPKYDNSESDAKYLLEKTHNFLKFVLDFLKQRQVEPSDKKFQNELMLG